MENKSPWLLFLSILLGNNEDTNAEEDEYDSIFAYSQEEEQESIRAAEDAKNSL